MKIGVLGAGVMGGGIAQFFAEKGFAVQLWDISPEFSAKGLDAITQRLIKSVEKGSMPPAEADAALSNLRIAENLDALSGCELVIEAVVEDAAVKQQLYAQLETILADDAIIGSNTSSLSITELSAGLRRPERFMGIHFFNPPTKLELVELVKSPATDAAREMEIYNFLIVLGKKPVRVADSTGFIVNRLLIPFINEAARLLDRGVASAEDIDIAMKAGAAHPTGPLQLGDLIGLDVCLKILEEIKAAEGEAAGFEIADSLRRRVAAGKLGRKTKAGFYQY